MKEQRQRKKAPQSEQASLEEFMKKKKEKRKKKKKKTTKGFQKTTEHQSKVQEMHQKKIGSTGDNMSIIAMSLSRCSINILLLLYEYKRTLRKIV